MGLALFLIAFYTVGHIGQFGNERKGKQSFLMLQDFHNESTGDYMKITSKKSLI